MSKKEKQKVNLSMTMPPEDAYDDDDAVYDAAYFANLAKNKDQAKTEVAPPSPAAQMGERDRARKIKELYPDYYEMDISLDSLEDAPEEWNFFPRWNEEQMTELMENISVYGQLSPALVWDKGDGHYMILGGHNRFHAISKLHEILSEKYPEEAAVYTTMRCNVYAHDTLDEVEARKIIIFDNTIRRENSKSILRRSIINMNQLMKETRESRRPDTKRKTIREQIAESMNVSPRTVSGIVHLRNLIPEFWPLFDSKDKDSKLSDSLGQAISYLPPDLQKYIYDQGLFVGAKLSSYQLKKLREAENEEDVQQAFAAPRIYTVSAKSTLTWELTEGYKGRTIACREEEIPAIIEAVQNANVSQETKDAVRELLRGK